MRTKSSALIVILGPLLIILLVGLALNKPTTYSLTVGYYTPDQNNPLTNSFVEEITNNNFLMSQYNTPAECIQSIKSGTTHTCIIFPQGFEMGNNDSNNLEFHVDYSRTNLVYQIIEVVSKGINIRSSELSKDLTQVLLTKISNTKNDMSDNLLSIITIKSIIDTINEDVGIVKSKSEEMDFSADDISLTNIKNKAKIIYDDAKALKTQGLDAVSSGKSFVNTVGNVSGSSVFIEDLNDIEDDIYSIYNTTPDDYDSLETLISNTTSKISSLKTKLTNSNTKNQEIIESLNNVQDSLSSLKNDVDNLKSKIEESNDNLKNIDITSAESIVSPIRTEIKPVLAEDSSQINFLFPALLVLLIMFIGIMLSSALIIMEKNSKAYFRNLITPTKQQFFVFTTFFTSLMVLLAQTVIILALAIYFLKSQILANLGLASLIIIITISIFILLGMIIGYASQTQEAATMLSIAVGSILLLLSNLILPIESMAPIMKNLTAFNPYVVSSELLKKIFLFKATFLDIFNEILFLLAFLVLMIAFTYIVDRLSRAKIIKKSTHTTANLYGIEDKTLVINNKNMNNEIDLLEELKNINNQQFKEEIKPKEIYTWMKKNLKNKKLAKKIKRKKKREDFIKVLTKDLVDKQKKMKKTIDSSENN